MHLLCIPFFTGRGARYFLSFIRYYEGEYYGQTLIIKESEILLSGYYPFAFKLKY